MAKTKKRPKKMNYDGRDQTDRLRTAMIDAGLRNAAELALAAKMNHNTVRSLLNGTRPLTAATAGKLAVALRLPGGYVLFGEYGGTRRNTLDTGVGESNVSMVRTNSRVRGLSRSEYDQDLDLIRIKGSVRGGYWTKSYILPEPEWIEMHLPKDPRFPGVQRHAFAQLGHAMDRVCRHGGTWVFVYFSDLPGQGPAAGQYVVVERERRANEGGIEVEASVRKLVVGQGGRLWLHCESDDTTFEPIPTLPSGDILAVKIIGRVTDIVNRAP